MGAGLHSEHGQPGKGPPEWVVEGLECGDSRAAREADDRGSDRTLGSDLCFSAFSQHGLGQVIPHSVRLSCSSAKWK